MSRIAIAPSQVVFLQRGVQAGSGLITLLLVVRCLSAEEQGYYYAIGSLLSGYALFDLGLANPKEIAAPILSRWWRGAADGLDRLHGLA